MPKKTWTPEERQAFADKMKAARAAKQKPQVEENIVQNEDENALLKRILELEARLNAQGAQAPQAAPSPRTVTVKYSFNPEDYPDPRDRFFEEPKLQLRGFNKNWFELGWEVQKVNYEEDGIKLAAPRFNLEVYGVIEDPVTGEPSNKRYTMKRGVFFEDPDSFLEVASRHGVEIPERFEKWFMDEMRYLNMRDFLLDMFYPSAPTSTKQNKTEMVIGNKLVEVWEASSTDTQAVPFSDLKG